MSPLISEAFLIFYIICIALYSAHLISLEFASDRLPKIFKRAHNLSILPLTSLVLSIVVTALAAVKSATASSRACSQDGDINPDIGGVGVLFGLFLPTTTLAMTLFIGNFTAEAFGTKELCLAQIANLLYLFVNLAKSANQLNRQDTLIAYSTMDATAASVAMAISDKDVLAARTVLLLGTLLQIGSFGVQGFLISQLRRFDQSCLSQMPHPCFSSSTAVQWTFWAVRIFATLSPLPSAHRLSKRLHKVEHAPRDELQEEARIWYTLPSTLINNYLVFLSTSIVQGVSALLIAVANDSLSVSWERIWTEWGQSASLIVAMVAVVHVGYSFYRLFRTEAVAKREAVCKANNISFVRAAPPQHQLLGSSWSNIVRRCPFGKIELVAVNQVLTDRSTLDPRRDVQITMTPEDLDKLWEDLVDSFNLNDQIGVKNSLDRRAPLNRKNQHDEYPIHMAARLGNLSILKQTYLPGDGPRWLFSENDSGHTPLQIAKLNNKQEATIWLSELVSSLLGHRVFGGQAHKDLCTLADKAIDSEDFATLDIITTFLPKWEHGTLEDRDGNIHSFFVTAILRSKERPAMFLSRRFSRPFKPSKEDLDDFYNEDDKEFQSHLHDWLVENAPGLLDPDPLGLDLCSTSFSLEYICKQVVWHPNRQNTIARLVSRDIPLSNSFLDTVYNFPARPLECDEKAMFELRGSMDWSEFRDGLKMGNAHKVGQWIRSSPGTENWHRMLQTSSQLEFSAVSGILNFGNQSIVEKLLKFLEFHGAAITGPFEAAYHPFAMSAHWATSVKKIVLDMALAQENCESTPGRESTPGSCIWAICDALVADKRITISIGEWYLQYLEFLLNNGAYYKERRYQHYESGIHTPFQMICDALLDDGIMDLDNGAIFKAHTWVLEEASKLLEPWEEIYRGKRAARPSKSEHVTWKSFGEDDESEDGDSEAQTLKEDSPLISTWTGHKLQQELLRKFHLSDNPFSIKSGGTGGFLSYRTTDEDTTTAEKEDWQLRQEPQTIFASLDIANVQMR